MNRPIPARLPYDVPKGCVLYYDMQDLGTLIADHSGQRSPATVTGATIVAAPSATARSFDGDDALQAAGGFAPALGSVLTMEAWIRQTTAARQTVIGRENAAGAAQLEVAAAGNLAALIDGEFIAATSTTPIVQSAWCHIVYARTGVGASTHAFYHNGVSQGISTNSATNFTDSTMLYIGRRAAASQFFTGQIGIVRIYNRALTAAEVLESFRADAWRYGVAA